MNERLLKLSEYVLSAQTDADSVGGSTYVPADALLTHISHSITTSGSATATLDIQDDGTDIITALDAATAALYTLSDRQRIAGGSKLELDLNLTSGSASGNVVLWGETAE